MKARGIRTVLMALLGAVALIIAGCQTTPPAPTAPTTGSLAISVTPADATISVAGPNGFSQTFTGSKLLEDLEPGSYTISASKDGYVPQDKAVVVEAGQTTSVDFALEQVPPPAPDTGNLAISVTPADATISVAGPNGFSQTFTGSKLLEDLEPGGYTITASRTGYVTADQSVVVTAGETTSVNIVLEVVQQPTVAVTATPQNKDPEEIAVTVQVDEGVAVKEIRLYVDDVLYETRVISSSSGVAPLALQYNFMVYTGGYDPATGQPVFYNGSHVIRVEVESATGGVGSDQQTVQWDNSDIIAGFNVVGNSAEDSGGNTWYGNGDVTASFYVVNYSGASYSIDPASVTATSFDLVNTGGSGALSSPTTVNVRGGATISSVNGLSILFAQTDNSSVENSITIAGIGSFGLDNVAPTISGLAAQRSYEASFSAVGGPGYMYYNADALFVVDAIDGGVGVDNATGRLDLDDLGTLANPDYPSIVADGITPGLAGVAEATYSVTATIADLLGNTATPASVGSFTVDNTAPTIGSITQNGNDLDGAIINLASVANGIFDVSTNATSPSFNGNPFSATVSDDNALYQWYWGITGATLQTNTGNTTPAQFDPDNNVSYDGGNSFGNLTEAQSIELSLTAVDEAGNSATVVATFGLDVNPPTVSLDPNVNFYIEAGQTYPIGYTAADTLAIDSAWLVLDTPNPGVYLQTGLSQMLSGTSDSGIFNWQAIYSDSNGFEPEVIAIDWAGNASTSASGFMTWSNQQDYLDPTISAPTYTPNPVNAGTPYLLSAQISDNAPAGVLPSGVSRVDVATYDFSAYYGSLPGDFIDFYSVVAQASYNSVTGEYEAQLTAPTAIGSLPHIIVAYDSAFNFNMIVDSNLSVQ
ncbi:PEGA domain-containing protein [Deinococcota bacterium DY0809b]